MTQQAYFSDNKFGTDASNGLSLPSFRNVASGFGLAYQSINNIIELEDFLKSDEFNSLKPMLIEVFVDPAQAFEPKLASRINADGTMSSPELDDMAPFLSETELSQNRLS